MVPRNLSFRPLHPNESGLKDGSFIYLIRRGLEMKDTELAQIALTKDHTGAIANPIYLSTAYQHPHLGQSTGYDYTRTKNPTRTAFEESFAKLEKALHLLPLLVEWQQSNSFVTSSNLGMKCS